MNQNENENSIQMDASWLNYLEREFHQAYMQDLKAFLLQEKQSGKEIYPSGSDMLNAFNYTPFHSVKIVILGQDPYHGPGQAHGLSFSVKKGVPVPPSLQNIYKELHEDIGFRIPDHGDLTQWAQRGVLLLNSVLTVEKHKAASHRGRGWEQFTDAAISLLNAQKENLVFILWGSSAQQKGAVIDTQKHLVLKAPHPSPLSAYRGFFGSKPFSKANVYLQSHGLEMLDWALKFS